MAWESLALNGKLHEPKRIIHIAIPNVGTVQTPWAIKYGFMMYNFPREFQVIVKHYHGQPVATARNIAATHAMADNAQYLLFLDSDTEPTNDIVSKLLQIRKPIVGAAYRSRSEPYNLVATYNGQIMAFENVAKINSVIDVTTIGFGCCLIEVRLLHRLAQLLPDDISWICPNRHTDTKYDSTNGVAVYSYQQSLKNNFTCFCNGPIYGEFFKYNMINDSSIKYGPISEDYHFCILCKKIGIPVTLDLTTVLDHEITNFSITKEGLRNPTRGGVDEQT